MCITYGRPDLLPEAVESFLRQDYKGPKELVILNDYPGMVYEIDHPDVIVHNVDERFPSLGGKRNKCAMLCSGEVLLPWDDDDISLPWRISMSAKHVSDSVEYWKPASGWFWRLLKSKIEYGRGPCHGMAAFTPRLFWRLGGYIDAWKGCDKVFEFQRRKAGYRWDHKIAREDIFYIYRWGTGYRHLCNFPRGADAYELYAQDKALQHEPGVYAIKPFWRRDYVALVQDAPCELAA